MDITIGPRLEKALKVYLTACRRVRTERDVDDLLNLLVSVVDPELRLHRFGEHLRIRPVDEAAWSVSYLQERLKLAASRRAHPEALEAIAQDDRWIVRYPVKVALANNPATPTRIVLGLLPYLMRQDLRDLSAGASRAEVRAQAAALSARWSV